MGEGGQKTTGELKDYLLRSTVFLLGVTGMTRSEINDQSVQLKVEIKWKERGVSGFFKIQAYTIIKM